MLNNEKGFALLTVVVTLFLILTFSGILIVANVNSLRQLNLSEAEYQAIDLAEMGVTHYEMAVKNQLELAMDRFSFDEDDPKSYEEQSREFLFRSIRDISLAPLYPVNGDQTYYYSIEPHLPEHAGDTDGISYTFTSKGVVKTEKGEKIQRLRGTITIVYAEGEINPGNGGTGGEPDPPLPPVIEEVCGQPGYECLEGPFEMKRSSYETDLFFIVDGDFTAKNVSRLLFNDSLYINGDMDNSTRGQNNVLEIKEHLFITGSLNTQQNHIDVFIHGDFIGGTISIGNNVNVRIKGDAYFTEPIQEPIHHRSSLCVQGRAYLWENEKWIQYPDFPNSSDCRQDGGEKEWILDPDLQIEYDQK